MERKRSENIGSPRTRRGPSLSVDAHGPSDGLLTELMAMRRTSRRASYRKAPTCALTFTSVEPTEEGLCQASYRWRANSELQGSGRLACSARRPTIEASECSCVLTVTVVQPAARSASVDDAMPCVRSVKIANYAGRERALASCMSVGDRRQHRR